MAAPKDTKGDLGFEAELFKAADKLRQNVEPSEYKHIESFHFVEGQEPLAFAVRRLFHGRARIRGDQFLTQVRSVVPA